MPTYEYQCEACSNRFEKFQSITAAPIKKCPQCGKNKVKRLIGTGAGILFKGSGFYITDYRDKSYAEKAKAESGSGGETKSSDGKSTDGAKPAPTTEAKPSAPAAPAAPAPAAKSESKPSKKPKS